MRKVYDARRHGKVRELIKAAKDKPCADCGLRYPTIVMDLDHLNPSTKKFELADAIRTYRSLDSVKVEIEKCEVVCSNCHRVRTQLQREEGRI